MINFSKFVNAKSIKELWSHEKSVFRIWIVLYSVALLLIFLLLMGSFVWFVVDKENYLVRVTEYYTQNKSTNVDGSVKTHYTADLSLLIISVVISFVAALWFLQSVMNSYNKKNFMYISSNSYGAMTFFWGFRLLSVLWVLISSSNYIVMSNSYYLYYCALFFALVSYFLIGRNVTKIKRVFSQVEFRIMREKAFEEFQKNGGFNGIFPFMQNGQNQPTTREDLYRKEQEEEAELANEEEKTQKNNVKSEIDEEKKKVIDKLLSLPNSQLEIMARKLNIFGYEKLSKEELAEKIYEFTKKVDVSNKKDEDTRTDK